jgi:hypothetical protein
MDASSTAVLEVEGIDPRREESREAIAEMLGLLGYPKDWAGELERLSFARGRVWRDAA